jgi:8-oxo-dGTP pyrophosphatase MutT (NUDIX family)
MGGTLDGYLRHIAACNPPVQEAFLPWRVDGLLVGCVRPAFAAHLARFPQVFRVGEHALELVPELEDFTTRSGALEQVARQLAELELTPPYMGEPYAVTGGGREEALCVLDRAAAACFGVRSFGQHLNGFVRRDDGIHMWLGRRSRDRLLFPGALDNMVAGGLPHSLGLEENLVKECAEEAGVPADLARKAVPVGMVSYNRVARRGFRRDVLYCYDLELPEDFVPRNTDGEVEEFMLLPLQEVAAIVRETDDFKLNCNLVVIDFLIRHGSLDPRSDGYLALVLGLRQPLAVPDSTLGTRF